MNLIRTIAKLICLVFVNYCHCSYQYPFRILWRAAKVIVYNPHYYSVPSIVALTIMDVARSGITFEQLLE